MIDSDEGDLGLAKGTVMAVSRIFSGKLPYAEDSDPFHQHFKTFAGLYNRSCRQDIPISSLEVHFPYFVCCPEMKDALYSVQEYSGQLPYAEDSDPFHQHFKTFSGLYNRSCRQDLPISFLEVHFPYFVCCPEMKDALYSVQEYSGKLPYAEDSDPFHQHFKTFAGLYNRCFRQDVPRDTMILH